MPFLISERASPWARELLQRAAALGHSEMLGFLITECGVDPNEDDEVETWPCMEAAIDSNEPRAVRRLLELSRRRPALSDFEAAVPNYGLHDNSEIVQLLLDHGACDDLDALRSAAERASSRGCDFRDYFEVHWNHEPTEKQEDPRAIAHWFIVDVIECHAERVRRRRTFEGQRGRYADAVIKIAALELPVLLVMAVVDESDDDWPLLDIHTRWLIAHRTQQKQRNSSLHNQV